MAFEVGQRVRVISEDKAMARQRGRIGRIIHNNWIEPYNWAVLLGRTEWNFYESELELVPSGGGADVD